MKIKDMELNNKYTATLVVKSVSERVTKAGKPYLMLTLFDGSESIQANYWDWTSGAIPPVNSIVDVTATVGEWNGTKQLTVKAMSSNNTARLADFMPQSGKDINQVYADAYTLVSSIKDDTLRDITLGILESLKVYWLEVPGATSVHHAYVGGTLIHSLNTAKIAKSIAEHVEGANIDLCIAGAMLHDLGKLFTYSMDGINIDRTFEGNIYEHIFIGAEFLGNWAEANLPDPNDPLVATKVHVLRHIILSHHGKLEYGSPVRPLCIEAVIVNAADGVDATTESLRAASAEAGDCVWTDKIWSNGNAKCLTTNYIAHIMAQ